MTGYDKWTKILDILAIPDDSRFAADRRWRSQLEGRYHDSRIVPKIQMDTFRTFRQTHADPNAWWMR